MRLFGYCWKCHKFTRVSVPVPSARGIQVGICDDCDEVDRGQRRG